MMQDCHPWLIFIATSVMKISGAAATSYFLFFRNCLRSPTFAAAYSPTFFLHMTAAHESPVIMH
jgi:hypothetical protein